MSSSEDSPGAGSWRGDDLDAAAAPRLGLVSEVVDGEPLAAAREKREPQFAGR